MSTKRPFYSSVRPYAWRNTQTREVVRGIGLFKGSSLCLHLTEKEAVQLAHELLDAIEKGRRQSE